MLGSVGILVAFHIYVGIILLIVLASILTRSKHNHEVSTQFDFYLAGGMRGYEDKNKAMFLKVATLLRDQGHTVFNPGEVNDEELTFEECMQVDLDAVVNRCKGIAFLPGWKNSIGANTEALVAAVCGKPAYQVRLVKKDTQVNLRKISLAKKTLPYKTKRRS